MPVLLIFLYMQYPTTIISKSNWDMFSLKHLKANFVHTGLAVFHIQHDTGMFRTFLRLISLTGVLDLVFSNSFGTHWEIRVLLSDITWCADVITVRNDRIAFSKGLPYPPKYIFRAIRLKNTCWKRRSNTRISHLTNFFTLDPLTVLRTPDQKTSKQINDIMYDFLWDKKPVKN